MKARNMSRSVEDPGYGRRGDTLGNRRTQNRPIDPDDFFGDTLGSPKSGGTLNRNFGLPPSLQERVKAQLPLPKLGLSSPWWLKTGLKFCGSRRVSHVIHVIGGLLYSICGLTQFVSGIYFMLELPIFQLGSNIWTGAWNLFSGVATVSLACFGDLSILKAQVLLLLSLVVTIVNLINLIILEVGEWRGFLSAEDKEYIKKHSLEDLMHSAYICTTIGTVVAMISAFLSSQQTFCFLQLRGDDHKKQTNNNNHVDQVDSDMILGKDLVKRHDDDNLNLKTPIGPEPHPSWVYRHNYAALHSNRAAGSPVKRSISVLNAIKNGSKNGTSNNALPGIGAASTTSSTSTMDRVELLGGLHSKSPISRKVSTPGVFTISESVSDAGRMRHAVIRRHQSLYIHPKTSSEVQTMTSHFKFTDSNSEVRAARAKTLQRSKTTVGQTTLSHKPSAIQSLQRTFRGLKQQQLGQGNTPQSSSSGFRFDHNNNSSNNNNNNNINNYSLKRKSTSPNRYHHYPTDEMCEFQAGPSFDLPDREKLRRNGWQTEPKYVNSGVVGRNVIFDTSDSTIRRSAVKRVGPSRHDDLLTDSSAENIRYQAVEGLVQDSRQKRQTQLVRQGFYSSLENLLSIRDPESERIQMGAMVRYGSTGSLSSLASDRVVIATGGTRDVGMTPTSLYSQNSSSVLTKYFEHGGLDISQDDSQVSNDVIAFSSEDLDDLYDVPRKPNGGSVTLRKSNSRVSSNGKLRLRVESFRNNNNAKSSSGTQTDISVVRNATSHKSTEQQQEQEQAAYAGQYKKRAAPSKPARKQKVLQSDMGTEIRSDRSASPDNSSTSGYSSPSAAGAQDSKESSPCNSKIPSPPHSMNDQQEEEEESNKITVIQIVPKEAKDRNEAQDTDGESRCSEPEQRPSSDESPMMLLSAATMMQQHQQQQQQQHQQTNRQTRRELPRIATNGTLTRPGTAGKRRLPDRALPAAPEPVHAYPPGVRLFRSNLPRPAPMVHHHQQFAQGRVPLPPVPELDRSDHERESISPIPEQRNLRPVLPKPKALPSPLVTPIQPAERHLPKPRRVASRSAELPMLPPVAQNRTTIQDRQFYGRNGPTLHQYGTTSSDSTRVSDYESSDSTRLSRDLDDDFDELETGSSQESSENVDDRLKALIELMGSRAGTGIRDGSGNNGEKEDTLKYLSQLETVARKLKDQLLSDRKKLPSPMTRRQSTVENAESDC